MKRIDSTALSDLPREITDLVRNGVYSLYAVKLGGAEYALVTNRGEHYFLSGTGSIVPGLFVENLKEIIIDLVAFSDPAPERAMINCA